MKRSARQIDEHLEAMIARCRAEGMNTTPQRVAIYRELLEALNHPSPEALYDRVRARMPSLSLATIYKTLDTLVSFGFAAELPSTGDTKRYDANMESHHHLVCTRCRSVEDFDDAALSAVKLPRRAQGFSPEYLSIHVHGLCRRCAQPSTAAPLKEKNKWPRN